MGFLCYSPCLIVCWYFPQPMKLTVMWPGRLSHTVLQRASIKCSSQSGRHVRSMVIFSCVCVSVCLNASVCGIHYHIPPQRPLHRKKLCAFLPPLWLWSHQLLMTHQSNPITYQLGAANDRSPSLLCLFITSTVFHLLGNFVCTYTYIYVIIYNIYCDLAFILLQVVL